MTSQQSAPPFAGFREFFKLESAGGLILFVAALLAMIVKKFPAGGLVCRCTDHANSDQSRRP